MAFPTSTNFDYWLGGRALVTRPKSTGDFDYWLGGRPIAAQATTVAAGNIKTFVGLATALTKTWDGLALSLLKTWNGLSK